MYSHLLTRTALTLTESVFLFSGLCGENIQECWKVLSPTRKETSYSDRKFWFSYILFIIIIGGILVLYIYIYITRLASKEIFAPSNKIHREVGRGKDLSAPLYKPSLRKTQDWPKTQDNNSAAQYTLHALHRSQDMNSPSFVAAKVIVLFVSKHLHAALIRCKNTLRWLTTSCWKGCW